MEVKNVQYFFDYTMIKGNAKKLKEKRDFFVLPEEDADELLPNQRPELTETILKKSNVYRDFSSGARAILVNYVVYSTEENVNAATQPNVFEELIANGKAEKLILTPIEFTVTNSQNVQDGKKKPKRLTAKTYAIFGGIATFCLLFGLVIGKSVFSKTEYIEVDNSNVQLNQADDGMFIPEQQKISENAEQIAVTIDRSYFAVPKEDLELKGEVIDGKAIITLPRFDPNDVFNHVFGYTFGFSTVQDAKKIEYQAGGSYEFTKDTKLYRVLVKYGGGSGTKNDPYLLNYYDQLELMAQDYSPYQGVNSDGSVREKSTGVRGYFKQIADINFPSGYAHRPINTLNQLKEKPDEEYFEFDGGGYKISGLTTPLFETVSGAVIKNVNVTSSAIATENYKNYGFIACQIYNYQYRSSDGTLYETGETLVQNCTVSHSSITLKPAVVYDEKGKPVTEPKVVEQDIPEELQDQYVPPTVQAEYAIGAVTGVGGQIESCYVTDFGAFNQLENYVLYVGGISGKPASVKNSGVNYVALQGNIFHAGGVVGSAAGARLYNAVGRELPIFYGGNIQGCFARDLTCWAEKSGGGIAGIGSTNVETAVISNCYASGLVLSIGIFEDDNRTIPEKIGDSGGVLGCDGTDAFGHFITATVSQANFFVVGNLQKTKIENENIRLAYANSFYLESIFTIINRNTVTPENPKEIFTGNFVFEDEKNLGESGPLPFPQEISGLFLKTVIEK